MKYDIQMGDGSYKIIPHYCGEYGCYGTNPEHGYTWEEAKTRILELYMNEVEYFLDITEEEYFGYNTHDQGR